MSEKRKTLTRPQADKARVLRNELTKVRCWVSGFEAGRTGPQAAVGAAVPGKDGLRLAIAFLDELLAGDGA